MATPGDEYSFGDVTMTVLGPYTEYDNENDMSAVVKVTYGDIDIIYAGDAEARAEYDIIEFWGDDVLDVQSAKGRSPRFIYIDDGGIPCGDALSLPLFRADAKMNTGILIQKHLQILIRPAHPCTARTRTELLLLKQTV